MSRIWQSILVSLLLLTSYQNCSFSSPVSFVSSGSSTTKNSGGNGDAYEGKPIGTFVRTLPTSPCAGGSNQVFGKLKITPISNTLEQINPKTCATEVRNVPDAELAFTPSLTVTVGLNDGVYVNQAWLSANDSRSLETWCQSDALPPLKGQDLLLSFSSPADYRLTAWSPGAGAAIDIPVERTLTNQILVYETQSLKLRIQANFVPSSTLGVLTGEVISSRSDIASSGALKCRLGADLDGVIWPSTLFPNLNFKHATFINKGQSAVIVRAHPAADYFEVIRWDFATQQITPLSPPLPAGAGPDLVHTITADEKYVIYYSQRPGGRDAWDLAAARIDGGGSAVLSQTPYSMEDIISCRHYYSPSSGRILFTEPLFPESGCFLRTNRVDGSAYARISQESAYDKQTYNFSIDEDRGEVYFTSGVFSPQGLKRAKLDGSGLLDLGPYFLNSMIRRHVHQVEYPLTLVEHSTEPLRIDYFLLDPETLDRSPLASAPLAKITQSLDGRYIIAKSSTGRLEIVDSASGQIYPLDERETGYPLTYAHFTTDSRQLIHVLNRDAGYHGKLYIADANGQNEKLLSSEGQHEIRGVHVTQELRTILYWAKEPNGEGSINEVSFDGLRRRKIKQSPIFSRAILSEVVYNSDRIFFRANADSDQSLELFVLYLKTGILEQLNNRFTEYGGVVNFQVINPQTVLFSAGVRDDTIALRSSDPCNTHLSCRRMKYAMFLWKE